MGVGAESLVVTDIERIAPGMAAVTVDGTRSARKRTLWVRAQVRKPVSCVRCTRNIPKGAKAYRTANDTDYRMRRLCEPCVGG